MPGTPGLAAAPEQPLEAAAPAAGALAYDQGHTAPEQAASGSGELEDGPGAAGEPASKDPGAEGLEAAQAPAKETRPLPPELEVQLRGKPGRPSKLEQALRDEVRLVQACLAWDWDTPEDDAGWVVAGGCALSGGPREAAGAHAAGRGGPV